MRRAQEGNHLRNYDDTSYAYAVGRIQAIENRMLDQNKLDLLIGSRSAEEALRMLQDAGYAEGEDVSGYEVLLSRELARAYAILKELAPDREVIDVFLLKNDYHNLKVLIKQEFSNNQALDYDNLLVENGTIGVDEIALFYVNREFDRLSPFMKEACEACIEMMQTTADPQMIDIILDKAMYREMLAIADRFGNAFVKSSLSYKLI